VNLSPAIAGELERLCESPVAEVRRAGGGDINEAYWVRLADERRMFLKTRADARRGEYVAEAAGLRWLAQPRALNVPVVVAVGDGEDARFLALEWIEVGGLDRKGEETLGRGLAALHSAGADAFGASARLAMTIGSLSLPNGPKPTWPEFYVAQRLVPLVAMARRRGVLSLEGERAVGEVCERIEQLAGPPEPPARLHGDLWVGNVLADSVGEPWLIDPTAYGGHREVDLAMLALFGDADSIAHVLAAYDEVTPLAEGWERRVPLWQLHPLLVHAVLFGGAYGAAALSAARSLLR
jgi:fructosamine-3-kinase